MTTSLTVVAGIGLIVAYCGCVLLVRHFSRWAVAREESRAHRYIPDAEDVARTQAEADLLVALAEVEYWRVEANDEFDRLLGRESA